MRKSSIQLDAPPALPAVGIAAPVGGGGLEAAAGADRVGIAAVPVVVAEVGVLLTLSAEGTVVESPAVLVLAPAGAARRFPPFPPPPFPPLCRPPDPILLPLPLDPASLRLLALQVRFRLVSP
jgi:hypothetical protein